MKPKKKKICRNRVSSVQLEFFENIQVELEFHNYYYFLVAFCYNLIVKKNEFYIETRFFKNQVSK